jgi:dTDP-4-amino-4,6-dideoxygalactose transaminase
MAEPRWVVPLSDVVGDDELVAAASDAIRSGWWSAGPRVGELERRFGELTGARHAIAVSNGTAALHLALLAAGVGPGDEVITPTITFVAAANAISVTGATPRFCDVLGAHDLNLDPSGLERAITNRTKAIVVLHYGGFACDIDAVLDLAIGRGLAVIEDAAHALGATASGRSCGTVGTAGCFSFFSNKNLPIGEGGMVVTDDDDVAGRVRLLRSHGMTTLTWDRHRGHASSYDVLVPGFNYRLDDIRAALALVQLDRLGTANHRRGALADRYVTALHGRHGVEIAFARRTDRADAAHHLVVAVLPPGVDRDAVRAALVEDGIQTSVHYPPIHTLTAHRDPDAELPRADALAGRLLTLPLYPGLADDAVDLVAGRLLAALRAHSPD